MPESDNERIVALTEGILQAAGAITYMAAANALTEQQMAFVRIKSPGTLPPADVGVVETALRQLYEVMCLLGDHMNAHDACADSDADATEAAFIRVARLLGE